jgi:hypothetical protein
MPLIVGVVLSRALAFVALEAFIRVKHAYQCPGASTEAASTAWASVQECPPEQASRLPVDVPRFPEGSVSWPESVFATFRVADA